MWIEIGGLPEPEHEGVKRVIVLVNLDSGIQIVKRIKEQATSMEKGITKNEYQLILRNLNGEGQVLKAPESMSELDREVDGLKKIIKEKEGKLFKL